MHVDGRELEAALRRVTAELDKELPRGLALAGDLIANAARRTTLFKDRTGRLRRSIMRGPITGSFSAGTLSLDVRAGGLGGVSYARHVHDGTRAHEITPSRRKALRFARAGGFAFARVVRHPGTVPRPFMDEAVQATAGQVERVMSQVTGLAFARAGFDVGGAP